MTGEQCIAVMTPFISKLVFLWGNRARLTVEEREDIFSMVLLKLYGNPKLYGDMVVTKGLLSRENFSKLANKIRTYIFRAINKITTHRSVVIPVANIDEYAESSQLVAEKYSFSDYRALVRAINPHLGFNNVKVHAYVLHCTAHGLSMEEIANNIHPKSTRQKVGQILQQYRKIYDSIKEVGNSEIPKKT